MVKRDIRRITWLIAALLIMLFVTSCDLNPTVNDEFFPYCTISPEEAFFAKVKFKSADMIYPKTVTIDGKHYIVAIIDGFEDPKEAAKLTGTLTIDDNIMAIYSGSFAYADNVTEVILPAGCKGLGERSLPQNITSLTCSGYVQTTNDLERALSDEAKLKVKHITFINNGLTTFKADQGKWDGLESVTIVPETEGSKVYWPSLPKLSDKLDEGLYFAGWFDSDGNKILSASLITTADATAHPEWADVPPEPEPEDQDPNTFGGMGFSIPYILMVTNEDYSIEFTDNEDGTFTIMPVINGSESWSFETTFGGKRKELELGIDGAWHVSVSRIGMYSFSVFFLDAYNPDKILGYAQVSFNATSTVEKGEATI